MSVVVIDHHQACTNSPEVDALVNPNRLDDLSGLGHPPLSASCWSRWRPSIASRASAAFQTRRCPSPICRTLHHVALGTVADVVPLIGLNGAFVAKGLIAMRRRDHATPRSATWRGSMACWRPGISASCWDRASMPAASAAQISACGFCSSATASRPRGSRPSSPSQQRASHHRADGRSAGRAERSPRSAPGQAQRHRHGVRRLASGVVGLVASRLKEKFAARLLIALEPGGIGTGSGLFHRGVDLGKAVRQAVNDGILLKGGGHAMAAGVTLRKEKAFLIFFAPISWKKRAGAGRCRGAPCLCSPSMARSRRAR